MEFLYEQELRDYFWSLYGYRKTIEAYRFETARRGGMDLATLERVRNRFEFCAFEFKLNDMKRVITQAKHNMQYVHKSFIVIPDTKEKLIRDKYWLEIVNQKYLGVITVEHEGRWNIIHQPRTQPDELITLNQSLLSLFDLRK